MPNNSDSVCRKVGEKLERAAPHAIILHCGTNWAQTAPPNTLTDSYNRFLPETRTYLNSMTRTPKVKTLYYYNTEVDPVLRHWWVVYAILLLC